MTMLRKVFPEKKLERLDISHPIYHTLYDHDEYLGGDKLIPGICDHDEAILGRRPRDCLFLSERSELCVGR